MLNKSDRLVTADISWEFYVPLKLCAILPSGDELRYCVSVDGQLSINPLSWYIFCCLYIWAWQHVKASWLSPSRRSNLWALAVFCCKAVNCCEAAACNRFHRSWTTARAQTRITSWPVERGEMEEESKCIYKAFILDHNKTGR